MVTRKVRKLVATATIMFFLAVAPGFGLASEAVSADGGTHINNIRLCNKDCAIIILIGGCGFGQVC
jgi:hypothetical protein